MLNSRIILIQVYSKEGFDDVICQPSAVCQAPSSSSSLTMAFHTGRRKRSSAVITTVKAISQPLMVLRK